MNYNQYLKDLFVDSGFLKEEDANRYFEDCSRAMKDFLHYLVEDAKIDINRIYMEMQTIFGYEFIQDLNIYAIDQTIYNKFNQQMILQKRIIPFKQEGNKIYVMVDQPFVTEYIQKLTYYVDCEYVAQFIDYISMDRLVSLVLNKAQREDALNEYKEQEKGAPVEKKISDIQDYVDAPSVQLADSLLKEAINEGASDIHIEPLEKIVRVRFRIDGVLKDHLQIDTSMYPSLLARYKIMANLDISERRIPQDGKLSIMENNQNYDFRISTLPLIYGEKIVIRLYSNEDNSLSFDKLTSDPNEKKILRGMIEAPHGIILLTGPTGSGKTTTLYAFLKQLNKVGVNIVTIEDPVENQIGGINQLQTNNKAGLTFASALRSILRQDPNIIMVGEIRDEETAHIAVQAAITGHLVFSTLHTNDAVMTITRLIDMGIEPYLVSDSLVGAIAQRLVRKLCPYCKKEHIITAQESEFLDIKAGTKVYEADGCDRCNHTGYIGRKAVFEILSMSDRLRSVISSDHENLEEIRRAAESEGFITLAHKTSELIVAGETSIEEFKAINNVSEILQNKRNKKSKK